MIELVRLKLRLATTYEIAKCLARFRSAEEAGRQVVRLINETLPIASAVLLEGRLGELRMLVWHGDAALPETLLRAEANARTSFAFVAAPAPGRSTEIDVARFPMPLGARPQVQLDGSPADASKSFMMLPLSIERGAIFGALQIEGAMPLDEDDLSFLDAVVQMLALAIDRHCYWSRGAGQMRRGKGPRRT